MTTFARTNAVSTRCAPGAAEEEREHPLREEDHDRERRERAERVDVVGPRELPGTRERATHR